MKTPLLTVLAAAIIIWSTTGTLTAQEAGAEVYTLRALSVDNMELIIVRLGSKSGRLWQLDRDEWVPIASPRQLDLANYDCALTPVGKKTWILTLWDTSSGQTFIYASATKGWRFARDREYE